MEAGPPSSLLLSLLLLLELANASGGATGTATGTENRPVFDLPSWMLVIAKITNANQRRREVEHRSSRVRAMAVVGIAGWAIANSTQYVHFAEV